MNPHKSAEWWREYRARRRLEGRAVRRPPGKVRDRREEHRRYELKRQKLRAEAMPPAIPPLHTGHPLLDQARELVTITADAGIVYKFLGELTREDARSEAVLAMLEDRDPKAAVAGFLAREFFIQRNTRFLDDEALDVAELPNLPTSRGWWESRHLNGLASVGRRHSPATRAKIAETVRAGWAIRRAG